MANNNAESRGTQVVAAVMVPRPSVYSSSGKRKRGHESVSTWHMSSGVSVSTGFPRQLKLQIKNLYDGCWHCAASDTEACHVVGRHDQSLVHYLHTKDRLGIADVNQPENAIPLCSLCHDAFDDPSFLGWVLVPTDLKFFWGFEQKDFERRKKVFNTTGILPTRICPSPLEYRQSQGQALKKDACGGLYTSYILRHYFYHIIGYPKIQLGRSPFINNPCSWHGHPMVALEKAFKAIGQSPAALPPDVRDSLRDLHDLYEQNNKIPENTLGGDTTRRSGTTRRCFNQISNVDRHDDIGDVMRTSLSFSEQSPNPVQHRSKPPASGQPRRSERLIKKNQNTLKRKRSLEELEPAEAISNCSSSEDVDLDLEPWRKKHKVELGWQWGPGATSQMAMDFADAIASIPRAEIRAQSSVKDN